MIRNKNNYVTKLDYAWRPHDRKLLKEYGWLVHYVLEGDDGTLANIHTHGVLENFGQPDIQITIPIPQSVAHSILVNYVESVIKGRVFEVNKKYKDFLVGFDVTFKKAIECEREVLRMILPDKNGKFPEDIGCDKKYVSQLNGTLQNLH